MEFITRAYYKYWSWFIWNGIDTTKIIAPMVRWDCRALATAPFDFDDDLILLLLENHSKHEPHYIFEKTEKVLQLGNVHIL